MIEIKDLTKGYEKNKDVLKNLSLEIGDSCVFGLVGINGAGKSTLLRLIAGVLRAGAGHVYIDGENIYENERKKRELFFLPDDPFYTSNVTARGLAEMYASFYDFNEKIFSDYLQKFSLNDKKPICNFSKGMKRQVFASLALAIQPKYLLLDEAFDGLDPLARLVFKHGLVQLVEEKGATVIISSHSLRELEDVCDGYAILDGGAITCSGELVGDLSRLHKFQAAFEGEISQGDFDFECLTFSKKGKVVQLIARGDGKEIERKIGEKNPLFVEEIAVDFEELFIGEVQSRGYLQ